jgi:hypothetical protein
MILKADGGGGGDTERVRRKQVSREFNDWVSDG